MTKLNTLSLLVFTLLSFGLMSCSSSSEVDPANLIEDTNGVKVELEWNTGGSSSTAVSEADLDLYLKKSAETVDNSERTGSFEKLDLSKFLADGEYTINVFYFSGKKDVKYTILVTGLSTGKTYKVNSEFYASDAGKLNVNVAKVIKTGNKYTVSKL